MNRSNEVATVILQTSNTTALDAMLKNPKGDLKDVPIDHMTYIASNEVHTYTGLASPPVDSLPKNLPNKVTSSNSTSSAQKVLPRIYFLVVPP